MESALRRAVAMVLSLGLYTQRNLRRSLMFVIAGTLGGSTGWLRQSAEVAFLPDAEAIVQTYYLRLPSDQLDIHLDLIESRSIPYPMCMWGAI